jgi:hypothetical protein
MKSYCTALALLGLAVPALADSGKPSPWVLPYPSGYVTGTATQACIGKFSDDLIADGALLVGGNVFLLYAPDRFSAYSKVTGPFTSMAKVRLTGFPGAEGLLASSSAGLVLLHWDSTRQLAETLLPNSSAWANAVQLQSVPGEGGTDWICGLSSTHESVVYAIWDGAAITAAGTNAHELDTPALTLAAVHWNTDSMLDFAVDDGTGVRVHPLDVDTLLYSAGIGSTAPQLLRFQDGGAADNLVWLTKDPGGTNQILTVIHPSGSNGPWLEAPIDCGGAATVGRLTLADLDGNGLDDLVATLANDDLAQVLYHQVSGTMSFGLFSPMDLGDFDFWAPDLGQVYCGSTAVPVVAGGDIDGDGDADLLYAGQPGCANTAMVLFGKGVNEEAYILGTGQPPQVKAWCWEADWIDWGTPGMDDELAQLDLYPWEKPTTGKSAIATDIRVTIYARASATSGIEPQCLADTFWPATSTHITINLPPPVEGGEELPGYLVLQVSYVVRVGGVITTALPSWTGQFDRSRDIPPVFYGAGSTTTGGVNQPPPPPSQPPPSP